MSYRSAGDAVIKIMSKSGDIVMDAKVLSSQKSQRGWGRADADLPRMDPNFKGFIYMLSAMIWSVNSNIDTLTWPQ